MSEQASVAALPAAAVSQALGQQCLQLTTEITRLVRAFEHETGLRVACLPVAEREFGKVVTLEAECSDRIGDGVRLNSVLEVTLGG